MLGERGRVHSIRTPGPLPPVASSGTHLLFCFCNLYFWLCFPFPFPTESLWKNSTLVSVGLGKRGLIHSSARRAKGCQVPGESRCGWWEARALRGELGRARSTGAGNSDKQGMQWPKWLCAPYPPPRPALTPANSVLIGGEELRPRSLREPCEPRFKSPFPIQGA